MTIQGLASPADVVTVTNSSLRTSADSKGRGGSITVDATNLTLNEQRFRRRADVNAADVTDGPTSGIGDIALTSSTIGMTGGTVTVETSGARNAGDITVKVGMLTLANNAEISSNSLATASGDAGNVTVRARVAMARRRPPWPSPTAHC